MTRLLAIPVALFALAFLVAADKPDDSAKDEKALQGTWNAMTHEQGGNKSAEENTRQHKLIFDGKKFTIKQGDNVMASGTFTVDASKKPRHIDMKIEGGDDEKLQGKTSLGIYELDGDDLKWASNEPGAEGRPTDFTTKEGSKQMVVTLKRDKK